MHVTLHCHYPNTGLPPTTVTLEPAPELGATPEEVHEELVRMIRAGGRFEVPAVGMHPLEVWAETVRQVVVRA